MCPSELPPAQFELGNEDVESIEDDIDTLISKFIRPIDQFRSIAEAPSEFQQGNQKNPQAISNLKIDTVNYMESRVHAFYRMLGLPIVADQLFYNPGFGADPKNQTTRNTINNKVSKKDLGDMEARERHFKYFIQLFAGQGLDAAVFGLTQRIIKPFRLVTDGKNLTIEERQSQIIENLKKSLPNPDSIAAAEASFPKKVGYGYSQSKHLLRPFTTVPAIDYSVQPNTNKVCVPFLVGKSSTRISASPENFLSRPGIEFILRARLKDNVPDKNFLATIQNIFKQIKSPAPDVSTLNVADLQSTLEALAEQNNIKNADVNAIFGGFTSTQTAAVNQLIKTVKICIKLVHEAVTSLDKIATEITFLPTPNVRGFEFGGVNKDSVVTNLEKTLVILNTKKLNADREAEQDKELGEFCTSGYIKLDKTSSLIKNISELTQKKTSLVSRGLANLKTIEVITGEASGLGLVDILAVYTALWSIDIEFLLGLIDNEAAIRLHDNNPALRTQAVVDRKDGKGKGIQESLTALENKVSSVLTFADLLYTREHSSPRDNPGGDPS